MNKLNKFSLKNFKAFGSEQFIDVKPITLIYGQNCSGKSSILDGLALYSKIINSGLGSFNAPRLLQDISMKITGSKITLGNFEAIMHGQDITYQESIGFSIMLGENEHKFEFHDLDYARYTRVNKFGIVEFDTNKEDKFYSVLSRGEDNIVRLNVSAMREYIGRESEIIIAAIIDAEDDGNGGVGEEALRMREILQEASFLNDVVVAVSNEFSELYYDSYQVPPELRFAGAESMEINGKFISPKLNLEASMESVMKDLRERTLSAVSQLVIQQIKLHEYLGKIDLLSFARGLVYIGPHRENIPLNEFLPEYKTEAGAHPHAKRIGCWNVDMRSIEFINKWLLGRKSNDTNYSLHLEEKDSDPDVRFVSIDGVRLSLFDENKKIPVQLDNVGSGIGQILPILLTLVGYEDSTILIKQPELHIHPSLQSDIADMLIYSAFGFEGEVRKKKNSIIIETHSEHLLLRLMKRIRQTTNGELSDSNLMLKADDVSIIYVENQGRQSVVRELPLNENGQLIRDWPGGFFEEGLREVLF